MNDADFDPKDLTPELQPYDEDFDFGDGKAEDDMRPDEVMPKTGDNYINMEISLPKGGTLARVWVIWQKHDVDGNPTGMPIQSLTLGHIT